MNLALPPEPCADAVPCPCCGDPISPEGFAFLAEKPKRSADPLAAARLRLNFDNDTVPYVRRGSSVATVRG